MSCFTPLKSVHGRGAFVLFCFVFFFLGGGDGGSNSLYTASFNEDTRFNDHFIQRCVLSMFCYADHHDVMFEIGQPSIISDNDNDK